MKDEVKRTVLLLGILLSLMFACEDPSWVQEMNKVEVGMTRDKAIEILSESSWLHQSCSYSEDVTDDLFFFGDHHYDRAIAVIVYSDNESGKVIRVGSLDEPSAWHASYGSCVDRAQFQD